MSFFEALVDDFLEDEKTPPASPTTDNSKKEKSVVDHLSELMIGGDAPQSPATSYTTVPKTEASVEPSEPKQDGIMGFMEALSQEMDSKAGSAPAKDESLLDMILSEFGEEDENPAKGAAAPPKGDGPSKSSAAEPKSVGTEQPKDLGDMILDLFDDDADDE